MVEKYNNKKLAEHKKHLLEQTNYITIQKFKFLLITIFTAIAFNYTLYIYKSHSSIFNYLTLLDYFSPALYILFIIVIFYKYKSFKKLYPKIPVSNVIFYILADIIVFASINIVDYYKSKFAFYFLLTIAIIFLFVMYIKGIYIKTGKKILITILMLITILPLFTFYYRNIPIKVNYYYFSENGYKNEVITENEYFCDIPASNTGKNILYADDYIKVLKSQRALKKQINDILSPPFYEDMKNCEISNDELFEIVNKLNNYDDTFFENHYIYLSGFKINDNEYPNYTSFQSALTSGIISVEKYKKENYFKNSRNGYVGKEYCLAIIECDKPNFFVDICDDCITIKNVFINH
ncbi:MAG: hypothetical protein MJ089_02485 [Ruminococcus sp.]|nr:hypothetical protein [Ruminococcus sp.]